EGLHDEAFLPFIQGTKFSDISKKLFHTACSYTKLIISSRLGPVERYLIGVSSSCSINDRNAVSSLGSCVGSLIWANGTSHPGKYFHMGFISSVVEEREAKLDRCLFIS